MSTTTLRKLSSKPILVSATEWHEQCLDVRTRKGLSPVKAWRYREMAVHHSLFKNGAPKRPAWSLTHVPSGLCMPCYFTSRAKAMAAGVEIDRLRNNWSDIDQDDVKNVKAKTVEILRKYAANVRSFGNTMPVKCNINGYGG